MAIIGYQFDNMQTRPEKDALAYFTAAGNIFYRHRESTDHGLFTDYSSDDNLNFLIKPSSHLVAGRFVEFTEAFNLEIPIGACAFFVIQTTNKNEVSGTPYTSSYTVDNRQLNVLIENVDGPMDNDFFNSFKKNFIDNRQASYIKVPFLPNLGPNFEAGAGWSPETPMGLGDVTSENEANLMAQLNSSVLTLTDKVNTLEGSTTISSTTLDSKITTNNDLINSLSSSAYTGIFNNSLNVSNLSQSFQGFKTTTTSSLSSLNLQNTARLSGINSLSSNLVTTNSNLTHLSSAVFGLGGVNDHVYKLDTSILSLESHTYSLSNISNTLNLHEQSLNLYEQSLNFHEQSLYSLSYNDYSLGLDTSLLREGSSMLQSDYDYFKQFGSITHFTASDATIKSGNFVDLNVTSTFNAPDITGTTINGSSMYANYLSLSGSLSVKTNATVMGTVFATIGSFGGKKIGAQTLTSNAGLVSFGNLEFYGSVYDIGVGGMSAFVMQYAQIKAPGSGLYSVGSVNTTLGNALNGKIYQQVFEFGSNAKVYFYNIGSGAYVSYNHPGTGTVTPLGGGGGRLEMLFYSGIS